MVRQVLGFMLFLGALPAVAVEWVGTVPDADRQAIEAAAGEADAHWNARDAAGLASMYVDDASLVIAGGGPVRGKAAVLDYFTKSFARTPATMRHATLVDRATVLTPDLVLADTRVTLDRTEQDGSVVRVRDFNTLTLMARRDGHWRLHTVRAYPQTASTPGAAKVATQ